ncbi:MAG TPA: double-CXXCG motif protein, partial [Hyalangium sp.]|nr:double-CXXCG motif protein [Hyalangium sp.]
DCTPPNRPPPCPTCGRDAFRLPDELLLDAASLPSDVDLFRVADFLTVLICTERFVQAVQRLGLDDIVFREIHLR